MILRRKAQDLIVKAQQTPGAFPLVHDGQSAEIVFDANDAAVVKTVAEALAKDIALVTGTKPGIRASGEKLPKTRHHHRFDGRIQPY